LVRRFLPEGERGYSLIEVMVSMIILALAIIPMIGMFDMGLNGVAANSHYDKARNLANLKLEEAKNLPFSDVEDNFPQAGTPTPYNGTAYFTQPGADFATFQYTVYKDYMPDAPGTNSAATRNFGSPSGAATGLIRLTVEVRWGNDDDGDGVPDKSFTTTGLVAQ
jgi:prepilin-type N-terminal cleavage/methylation domain-containing protein